MSNKPPYRKCVSCNIMYKESDIMSIMKKETGKFDPTADLYCIKCRDTEDKNCRIKPSRSRNGQVFNYSEEKENNRELFMKLTGIETVV